MAQTSDGGGWDLNFDPETNLTEQSVCKLAGLIDQELLDGRMRQLADRPEARLTFGVEDCKGKDEASEVSGWRHDVTRGELMAEWQMAIVYRKPAVR